MEVNKQGEFSLTIDSVELSRGLRPSKRAPRNSKYLVESEGAVGKDQVLQVIEDLQGDRVDPTGYVEDGFPYPQIFTFTNFILVCGETRVYEYTGVIFQLVADVAAGGLWSAVDFFDFVYLSNGVVSLLRSPTSSEYSISTDVPICEAICNFNGQVITGGVDD